MQIFAKCEKLKNGVAKEIQNKMVPAARFELTTSKLGILRSILLSYGGIYAKNLTFNNQILSSQKTHLR